MRRGFACVACTFAVLVARECAPWWAFAVVLGVAFAVVECEAERAAELRATPRRNGGG